MAALMVFSIWSAPAERSGGFESVHRLEAELRTIQSGVALRLPQHSIKNRST
jgi:hypothetical protein